MKLTSLRSSTPSPSLFVDFGQRPFGMLVNNPQLSSDELLFLQLQSLLDASASVILVRVSDNQSQSGQSVFADNLCTYLNAQAEVFTGSSDLSEETQFFRIKRDVKIPLQGCAPAIYVFEVKPSYIPPGLNWSSDLISDHCPEFKSQIEASDQDTIPHVQVVFSSENRIADREDSSACWAWLSRLALPLIKLRAGCLVDFRSGEDLSAQTIVDSLTDNPYNDIYSDAPRKWLEFSYHSKKAISQPFAEVIHDVDSGAFFPLPLISKRAVTPFDPNLTNDVLVDRIFHQGVPGLQKQPLEHLYIFSHDEENSDIARDVFARWFNGISNSRQSVAGISYAADDLYSRANLIPMAEGGNTWIIGIDDRDLTIPAPNQKVFSVGDACRSVARSQPEVFILDLGAYGFDKLNSIDDTVFRHIFQYGLSWMAYSLVIVGIETGNATKLLKRLLIERDRPYALLEDYQISPYRVECVDFSAKDSYPLVVSIGGVPLLEKKKDIPQIRQTDEEPFDCHKLKKRVPVLASYLLQESLITDFLYQATSGLMLLNWDLVFSIGASEITADFVTHLKQNERVAWLTTDFTPNHLAKAREKLGDNLAVHSGMNTSLTLKMQAFEKALKGISLMEKLPDIVVIDVRPEDLETLELSLLLDIALRTRLIIPITGADTHHCYSPGYWLSFFVDRLVSPATDAMLAIIDISRDDEIALNGGVCKEIELSQLPEAYNFGNWSHQVAIGTEALDHSRSSIESPRLHGLEALCSLKNYGRFPSHPGMRYNAGLCFVSAPATLAVEAETLTQHLLSYMAKQWSSDASLHALKLNAATIPASSPLASCLDTVTVNHVDQILFNLNKCRKLEHDKPYTVLILNIPADWYTPNVVAAINLMLDYRFMVVCNLDETGFEDIEHRGIGLVPANHDLTLIDRPLITTKITLGEFPANHTSHGAVSLEAGCIMCPSVSHDEFFTKELLAAANGFNEGEEPLGQDGKLHCGLGGLKGALQRIKELMI